MGKTFKDMREYKDKVRTLNTTQSKKRLTKAERLVLDRIKQEARIDKFYKDGLA